MTSGSAVAAGSDQPATLHRLYAGSRIAVFDADGRMWQGPAGALDLEVNPRLENTA